LQGAGARPQTPDEAQALDADQQTTGNMLRIGATALPAGRAAAVVTRAATPAVRAVANVAGRNPAVTVPAAAITATTAVPGETQTPDPAQTTRDQITKLRQRQVELEKEQTKLTDEGRQFNNLNSGDSNAVKEAQRRLGLNPDGNWGPKTSQAIDDFKKRKANEIEANRRQQIQLGKDLETQERRLSGLEGEERLRRSNEDLSGFQRFMRDYGELTGYGAGLLLGTGSRWGVTAASDALSARRATRATQIMGQRARDFEDRVGRVNEFWMRGQRRSPLSNREPALVPDATSARGFRSNPNAPAIEELYRPSAAGNATADIGIPAFFAGDAAISYTLKRQYEQDVKDAEAAVDKEPSEANIERLQTARVKAGMADAVFRGMAVAAGSYPASALKFQRHPADVSTRRAEAELARLNRMIRDANNRRTGADLAGRANAGETGARLRYPRGTVIDGRNVGGRYRPRMEDN
jgi:hypothetical protein